jgi:hypothetical protein
MAPTQRERIFKICELLMAELETDREIHTLELSDVTAAYELLKRIGDRPVEDSTPALSNVAETVNQAVITEITNMKRLDELGFSENPEGSFTARGCSLNLYSCFGDWEITMHLPNGSVIGCDVPISKLSGRTAAEIQRDRQ